MLDAFYNQLFRPANIRPSVPLAFTTVVLAVLVMTFNAAGSLNLGASGVEFLLVLFLLGGCIAFFWFTAAVTFLASLWGGQGTSRETLYGFLSGTWPLIFSGVAIAFQRLAPNLGMLLSLAIVVGTGWNFAAAIHQTQHLSWGRSLGLLVLALGFAFGAVLGLIVWPLMLFLGL